MLAGPCSVYTWVPFLPSVNHNILLPFWTRDEMRGSHQLTSTRQTVMYSAFPRQGIQYRSPGRTPWRGSLSTAYRSSPPWVYHHHIYCIYVSYQRRTATNVDIFKYENFLNKPDAVVFDYISCEIVDDSWLGKLSIKKFFVNWPTRFFSH
jgi:hypothetical protein